MNLSSNQCCDSRRYLHPQGNCSTTSEQVLALAELSAAPPPPPTHTPFHRAEGVWSDANRHLLTLHSLDHLNSRGWQGKWASLGYKSPNLDWLSLSAGWHERATVTHRVRRARDCSDASKKAGCRSLAVGEGEERLLWRKVSDWVSIQTGVGICLALIWHQYLCPHLCSLSVHAIPRPVSPRLWQCLFGLC